MVSVSSDNEAMFATQYGNTRGQTVAANLKTIANGCCQQSPVREEIRTCILLLYRYLYVELIVVMIASHYQICCIDHGRNDLVSRRVFPPMPCCRCQYSQVLKLKVIRRVTATTRVWAPPPSLPLALCFVTSRPGWCVDESLKQALLLGTGMAPMRTVSR